MGCTLNFLIGLLLALGMLLGIGFPIIQAPLPALNSLPCTVLTDRADVPVRVGPGENRAVRLFLPAGEPIAVIGQATIDGAGWWQIDLAGVEQAWVAQADVETAGDCASVPDADAPPVIPGQAPSAPVATRQRVRHRASGARVEVATRAAARRSNVSPPRRGSVSGMRLAAVRAGSSSQPGFRVAPNVHRRICSAPPSSAAGKTISCSSDAPVR